MSSGTSGGGMQQLSLDFFEVNEVQDFYPGAQDYDLQIKHLMNKAIQGSGKSRQIVAAEMSERLGFEVSHHMLYAYTSNKDNKNMPLRYLNAFLSVTDSLELMSFLVGKAGCTLLASEDVEVANLGRIEEAQQELARQREKVVKRLELNRRLSAMTAQEPDFLKQS